MAVIDGIRRGLLREPERLTGYASTIAHRIVASRIKILYAQRQTVAFDEVPPICDLSPNPERTAILIEQRTIARRILDSLCERDREVLIRFYMNEETAERIQHELGLTETQFRLIKSRAKSRFSAMLVRSMDLHTRKTHRCSPKIAQGLSQTV
jgi:RNA polymerase sigma factor (sigma-70 family)